MAGKLARRLRIGFVLASTAGVLTAVGTASVLAFVAFLRTSAGNAWIAARAENALDAAISDGDASVGGVTTDLWGHWRVDELRLTATDGTVVARVGRIGLDLSPLGLLRRTLDAPVLRAEDVELDLRTLPGGQLEIAKMFGVDPDDDTPGNGLPLAIRDGDVTIEGLSVLLHGEDGAVQLSTSGLGASARVNGQGKAFRLDDLDLATVLVSPGPGAVRARGRMWIADGSAWFDGIELTLPGSSARLSGGVGSSLSLVLDLAPLDLVRIDPLAGSPGLAGTWEGRLTASGPWNAVHVAGHLRDPEGLNGGLVADALIDLDAETIGWKGELDLAALQLGGALPATGPMLLDGKLTFDGHGVSWPADLSVDATFSGGPVIIGERTLDTLTADVGVANGKVTIRQAGFEGIAGALDVTGEVDVNGGPMDLAVTGRLTPDRLAALGVEGFATDGVLDARVTGDLQDEDAPITVVGSVTWAPFRYGRDVAFDRLSAHFRAESLKGVTSGTATVATTGGAAYGMEVARSDTPGLRFRVDPNGTRVSGSSHLEGLGYPGVLSAQSADAAWTADVGGAVLATAEVAVGPYDLGGFPGTGGVVKVDMGAESLAFDVALADGARQAWLAVGDYHLQDGRIAFDALSLSPTPRATWVAAAGAHLQVVDGGVRDAALHLDGNLGTVDVTGDLGRTGILDGRVILTGFQADSLAEMFPDRFDGVAGVVNLDARILGRADAATVRGTVDARGLWWGESVRWLDVTGRFDAADERARLDLAVGVAGAPLAEVHGWLPVHTDLAAPGLAARGDADLDVDLRPGDLTRLAQLSPALEGKVPDGEASARLHVGGRLGDPDLRLAGVAALPVVGWTEPGRVEFDLTRAGDAAMVRIDALDGLTPSATVTGTGTTHLGKVFAWALESGPEPDLGDYGMYLDDLDLAVAMDGLPVERLVAASGSRLRLRGALVGGFTVKGSPWAPTVEGGLQWLDPVIGHQRLEGAFLGLTRADTGYAADLQLSFPKGGGLAVTGTVPLTPDLRRPSAEWVTGNLDLAVSGPGVPLGVIGAFAPGFHAARGLAEINGIVAGSPFDPDPRVTLNIADGSFEYNPLGLGFTNLQVAISAVDRRVKLDKFEVQTEPLQNMFGYTELGDNEARSRISARGSMQLDHGVPDALSAVVKLENGAWVSARPDALLRLDGGLSVSGRWPAVEVRGDIGVHTGRLTLDAASFVDAAPLSTDPRLSIARRNVALAEPEAQVPSIFEDVVVDVGLDLNRNLELSWSLPFVDDLGALGAALMRMDLESRLGGTATVRLDKGAPTITGAVEIIDGELHILRSHFDIEQGTIAFTGGDPFEPSLDISARMSVPGATVDAAVKGTPSAPDVAFSSQEIADESAVLMVVITGSAPEDLTSGQGAAGTNALAGLLLNSVLSGTNLGSLSIDPDGSVKIGLPVSQKVYAETQFNPAHDIDENLAAIDMEWTMFPRVVLSAGLGNYESWTELYWEMRF
jgi:autotransporter translocation and assembly factor TamB